MNKTKVVCDVNIWYGFAEGTIDIHKVRNQNLIATFVNLVELAQTPRMTSNPRLFIKTLLALKNNNSAVIKANPYEYLIQAFFHDFKPDYSLANKILIGFDTFMTITPDSIPIQVLNETRIEIDRVIAVKNSISELMNKGLIAVRQYIKKNGGKRQRKKVNTIFIWKRLISDIVLSYSKEILDNEYKIDILHPSWHNFELLLLTFEEYFLRLEISGNRKFDINDWPDLINLVYVQPFDKYWTCENKWNDIFKENETLSKYVFNIGAK